MIGDAHVTQRFKPRDSGTRFTQCDSGGEHVGSDHAVSEVAGDPTRASKITVFNGSPFDGRATAFFDRLGGCVVCSQRPWSG